MNWVIILCFCCACAENAPKPRSAIDTSARQKTEASKMRGLKKADREVDFFFIGTGGSDIALRCLLRAFGATRRPYSFSFLFLSCSDRFQDGTLVLVDAPETCQHYFSD